MQELDFILHTICTIFIADVSARCATLALPKWSTCWTRLWSLMTTWFFEVFPAFPKMFFCMWSQVVKADIHLSPGACSRLEPLCIHTHRFTSFHISYSRYLFEMNPCCANLYLSVPLRVLSARTLCQTKASQIELRVLSVEVWSGSKCGVESKHFGNKRFYSGRLALRIFTYSSLRVQRLFWKARLDFLIIFYLQCT